MDKLSGTFSKVAKIAAAAFSIRAIYSFGKQAVQTASDIQEVQNVVDVAFGGMAYKVEEFAATSIERFGMSELAAKKTAGTYMAMSKGMGMASEQASNMAIDVAGLTGDIASFYNISQDLASTKLKAIWTGETEGLKDLGVVMTQANLNAYAMSNGFGKTIDQMSQAEQVQLRYLYVTDQLALAQGDFARTSGSWANQTRVLTQRWQEFMSLIGDNLVQVLAPVVQLLNRILEKMIAVTKQVNALLATLFGKQEQGQNASAAATQANADAMGELASQTDAAGKAAKGSLAPFDELNVLSSGQSQNISAGLSGNTGTSNADNDFIPPEKDISGLIDRIQKKLDSLGFNKLFQKFKGFLNKIRNQIKKYDFGEAFSGAFESAISFAVSALNLGAGILFPIAVALNIPGIVFETLNTLKSLFDTLKTVVDAVTPGIEKFVELGLAPIAEWIGGKIQDGLRFISGELQKWGNWFTEHQETFTQLGESIGELTGKVWAFIEPIADEVWGAFKEIISAINDLLRLLADAVMKLIQPVIDAWNAFMDWADSVGLLDAIIAGAKDTIDSIKNAVMGIITALKGVINFITGVFTGDWETAWEGVKQIFKGIWDTFSNIVKVPLNGIIKMINLVIGGINKLEFDIPDWIPVIGGNHVGLNIPEIPLLANGGLISSPTVAMMGEYSGASSNPEIVSPQSKMRETFLEAVWPLVDAMLEGTDHVVRAINDKDTSVYLDSTELSAKLYDPLNRERVRRGKAAIVY